MTKIAEQFKKIHFLKQGIKLFRCFVGLALLFSVQLNSQLPALELSEKVKVSSTGKVALGDVLASGLSNVRMNRSLKRIKLLDPPEQGGKKVYSNREMAELLRRLQRKNKSLQGFRFIIPKQVSVENSSSEWTKKALLKKIRNNLKDICGHCHFEFSSFSLPIIPSGLTGQLWEIKSIEEIPKGQFSLPVRFTSVTGSQRRLWIQGQLLVKKKVPILRRALSRGVSFKPSTVLWKWRDVTFATDTTPSKKKLFQSETAQAMRAGDIIWFGKIKNRKVLKYGDIVKVSIGSGLWKISTDGVVQSSASLGERVSVRIMSNKQKLSGIVVGKSEVKIQ